MRKLAVLVMIPALVIFMATAMASAGGDHPRDWRGIQAEYAMTGVGTCINSPGGFTANYTPPVIVPGDQSTTPPTPPTYGFNFSGSNLFTGTWTFERNGNGHVKGLLFGTATSPYPTPNASKISFDFDFTYTVTYDGTVYATMVDETFLATGVTGPLTGLTYTVQGVDNLGTPEALSFSGRISTDHKTMTLDSGNQIQKITISNGGINFQICNVGRVLIRVSEEDDD